MKVKLINKSFTDGVADDEAAPAALVLSNNEMARTQGAWCILASACWPTTRNMIRQSADPCRLLVAGC
jgi:hypothetical protein